MDSVIQSLNIPILRQSTTKKLICFEVSVKVTNVGDVAGKEVVQIYFQSPYTEYDKENGIEKASVELCGFDKTEILDPGASEIVNSQCSAGRTGLL